MVKAVVKAQKDSPLSKVASDSPLSKVASEPEAQGSVIAQLQCGFVTTTFQGRRPR